MHIQIDVREHASITVSDASTKIHQIDIKELSISTATILISPDNLQELVEKSMDRLSLNQKIDIIKYLAESIGGLWDDEEPLYKIEDIAYNKTLDKVFFKVEEVK